MFLIATLLLLVGALVCLWRLMTPHRDAPPASGILGAETGAAAMGVEATLYRAGAAGAEPLTGGSAVSPGDQLYLEIGGRVPLHVYVLDEDDKGEINLLFPIPGFSAANPLAAARRHRLPGTLDGVSQDWRVTSAGGRETILVVASRGPLAPLEEKIATIPAARPGGTGGPGAPDPAARSEGAGAQGALDPAALEGLRGIAGVAPTLPAAPGGRLAALATDLEARAKEGSGIWARSIELRNPAR